MKYLVVIMFLFSFVCNNEHDAFTIRLFSIAFAIFCIFEISFNKYCKNHKNVDFPIDIV